MKAVIDKHVCVLVLCYSVWLYLSLEH